MKGQKAYLLSVLVGNVKDESLDDKLESMGLLNTWNKYSRKFQDEEYLVFGTYIKSLDKEEGGRVKRMLQTLKNEGRIEPLQMTGTNRVNLMSLIDPDYSNVGYPLNLLRKKDFILLMCMNNVKFAEIISKEPIQVREPSNSFESLILNNYK